MPDEDSLEQEKNLEEILGFNPKTGERTSSKYEHSAGLSLKDLVEIHKIKNPDDYDLYDKTADPSVKSWEERSHDEKIDILRQKYVFGAFRENPIYHYRGVAQFNPYVDDYSDLPGRSDPNSDRSNEEFEALNIQIEETLASFKKAQNIFITEANDKSYPIKVLLYDPKDHMDDEDRYKAFTIDELAFLLGIPNKNLNYFCVPNISSHPKFQERGRQLFADLIGKDVHYFRETIYKDYGIYQGNAFEEIAAFSPKVPRQY